MRIRSDISSAHEQHLNLIRSFNDVSDLGRIMNTDFGVAGNEAFADSMKDLGVGLLSVTKWVGGKTVGLFVKGIQAAGTQLSKSFDDNQSFIKRLLSDSSKKSAHELKLKPSQVALITSKGELHSISRDVDLLIEHLDLLDKHSKDVLNYLDSQLIAVRKLTSAKKTSDVFAVIDAFEKIKYPEFKVDGTVLPGGKTWVFTDADSSGPKYTMSGDAGTGEGGDVSFSSSEASTLLNKLEKVNTLHQKVKDSYDKYLSFIKSWAEMVKEVDSQLTHLEYHVSKSALAEAEKLLSGNAGALAFYSGFTPRVVSYTDRYIHGVLGVFA